MSDTDVEDLEISDELLALYEAEEFEYEDFDDSLVIEDDSDLPTPGEEMRGWSYPYTPYPKQELAHAYDVDEILFGGAAGPGKDLALDTPVYSEHGWTTQGALRVGDRVLAPDGTWTPVVAAYGVERNTCYAITFSTGETITAGEGHLWTIDTAWGERTITTEELHRLHEHAPVKLPGTWWDNCITVTDSRITETVPTRCIAVAHPRRLYLVGHTRIPTHNTDWCLAECVNTCLAVPGAKVLLLRNTYGELLEEIRPRLDMRLPEEIAKYSREEKAYKFFNGARLRLGYLERDDQKRRYQGAEYVLIAYDELTLMPWTAVTWLRSRVRATGLVAEAMKKAGLRPRTIATSNPGGLSHTFVKQHYVDAAPPGKIVRDPVSKLTRVYVPATLDDNPSMPVEYRNMLLALDPEKRKALLEGSWDILEGVRFSQWNYNRHVIKPEEYPLPLLSGRRVCAIDYGFDDPFVALWGVKLGSGIIMVYRELYERELTATQQAELIKEHTTQLEWEAGIDFFADPSMWGRKDASHAKGTAEAPSVSSPAYDYMRTLGVAPQKARNDRSIGAYKLDDKLWVRPDGWPRLVVHNTCLNLIRTLPMLQRSKTNPDDISQSPKQDDHAYDALRYLLLALDPKDTRPNLEDLRIPTARPMTAGIMERSF